MAVIAAFKGVYYNFYMREDFPALVAPPYDVISEEEQERFYQADPYNVIRLILGKKKTGDSDWDNRYTRAADYFRRWESAGILIRAQSPCLYLSSLSYEPGNGEPRRTRWGIIALLRIEEEDSRVILPHERTFSAHRDDRLKLMRACNAQFSQIFGLYEDPDNAILNACKKAMVNPAAIAFDFNDGTSHQMWILQAPEVFKKVAEGLQDKTIFIADGHHRYETSRNYRNIMRARYGRRPANRSYDFVMTYLTNMCDEGLTVLPSHRLIKRVPDFRMEPFLEKIKRWFYVETYPLRGGRASEEAALLRERLEVEGTNNTALAFYRHEANHWLLFSLKPGVREEMGVDLHQSLKQLDVLVLSRFILQKGLGFSKGDLDNEELFHYQSSTRRALSQVEAGEFQMTFLLNPTKIDHVKEIAGNGLVMPRKSTYFYPKILTGMVFNKIDPHEIIRLP